MRKPPHLFVRILERITLELLDFARQATEYRIATISRRIDRRVSGRIDLAGLRVLWAERAAARERLADIERSIAEAHERLRG